MHWLVLLLVAASGAFPDDLLAAHNAVRARVGVPPLVWSQQLVAYSQEWADQLLREGRFYHHPNLKYGENLYEITGGQSSPARVVEAWAAEAEDYDYASGACRAACGHYKQLVWRNTKAVGCAVARAGRREVWVCSYDPPGNYAGRKPY